MRILVNDLSVLQARGHWLFLKAWMLWRMVIFKHLTMTQLAKEVRRAVIVWRLLIPKKIEMQCKYVND